MYIYWKADPKINKIDFFGKVTAKIYRKKSHCSDPKMTHKTFVPQPLEKSDKKHDHNSFSKKIGATLEPRKSSSTASKA